MKKFSKILENSLKKMPQVNFTYLKQCMKNCSDLYVG